MFGSASFANESMPVNERHLFDEWAASENPLSRTYDVSMKPNTEGHDSDEVGTLSKVKTLYEGPPKCHCCINWCEDPPNDLKESIEEQSESRKHAILIRMKKNHSEGRSLVLDSIVVQSVALKQLLQEVFRGYSGITPSLEKLVFKPPFHPFYFEWQRLNQICTTFADPIAVEHAGLLRGVLGTELEEAFTVSEDPKRNGVITFEYLWTIFRSGIDICTTDNEQPRFFRIAGAKYTTDQLGELCFFISAQYIDFDGRDFGWASTSQVIRCFQGTRPLVTLHVLPASLYPQHDKLQQAASMRGEIFRTLQQSPYHHAEYHGLARAGMRTYTLDGRIIVDTAAFQRFNNRFELKPLGTEAAFGSLDLSDQSQNHDKMNQQAVYQMYATQAQHDIFQTQLAEVKPMGSTEHKVPQLDDNLLYLCSPEVHGYCLKTKKWAKFNVVSVTKPSWNHDAFDNLVIAQTHKRLILSFVESQVTNKGSFDDVIEGKGRGLIMLLEGSPGVGKTLTAEAVADKLQRPLYAIGGGELGEDPGRLETSLNTILEIAAKWDAVLLLDECDVFIEKRSTNNLQRNSTVAVFLRLLEYYQGILFMTTNRIETIDPAFQSRIHLTIKYPKLTPDTRQQIWKHFLSKFCADSCMSDTEIWQLSNEDMNGREIKNLIKTSQLLARYEKQPVAFEHIQTVLSIAKESNTSW